MLTFAIDTRDHCRRLESFLRTLMPGAAAGYARKQIKSGAVRLNGTKAVPDNFLAVGDQVTIKESTTTQSLLADQRPSLDILFENDQIVIVNKPPGLAMHRTAELEENLVDLASEYLRTRLILTEGAGGKEHATQSYNNVHRGVGDEANEHIRLKAASFKLYPVNRLDRGTSGAVILAKSSSAAGMYGRHVKETGLDKLYLALVHGTPPASGTIDLPLDGKESETRFKILAGGTECSLLAVTPISGRMHQIRRHLEHIGHPVVGDTRYGGGISGQDGFALHSFRTALHLPDGSHHTICAPLPDGLLELCRAGSIPYPQLLETLTDLCTSSTVTPDEHLEVSA